MLKTIKRLIGSIDDLIDQIYVRLNGDHKYYNYKGFDTFMREVEFDIKYLNNLMDLPKYERDQEPLFQHLLKKYSSSYCPSFSYEYFSDQNKLEYCYLRVEIDELLEKAESDFSDFLSRD